ncbi:MAG: 2'-deoxycytidine 5'-triphosphate deaminase [Candidatus Rokubacteria bacterium 13_1_20CM_2_68_19]|nr:MAG: 2'-deoxycytidine 5'-triphosphate deaminase [Candidatus Rokubacteria bacterium 13_2_20CM_2_64_8]OLE44810.1 MAG: 2'-deoxycytidine 5'-triphosphate deaminase [Candidatus Rokubacteria bacterium 13_1_20CM_2_68_19]PYN65168.1 MAG: 2'-deoxycytidine 5'-triphosphate deaminase [Candidatus Rokubacteria bacterium]
MSVTPVAPRPGVLPYQSLRAAADAGWITATAPIDDKQFQPASLDLRLGPVAYQLRASFLPYRETVQARLDATEAGDSELVIDRISLESGATLQRGSVYLVPLLERLALPPSVRGRCNPKSTTGRLDVFTRVITDATPRFDEVAAGYRGALYLEVSPQSFPVRVQAGHSLNQLRLVSGASLLSDAELVELYRTGPLLYDDDDRPVPIERATFNEGLCMGIDLSGRKTGGIIGFRAHPNPPAVDLSRVDHYDAGEFWEPIKRPGRDSYILEANRFYILVSKERIRVPPGFAAEMVVYDAGAGEIRTHYAGFFDPGFGYGDGGVLGTKVVMEVRAREVPFLVYDGQISFKVLFERLADRPGRLYGVGLGSSYQNQTLTLSKQFRRG